VKSDLQNKRLFGFSTHNDALVNMVERHKKGHTALSIGFLVYFTINNLHSKGFQPILSRKTFTCRRHMLQFFSIASSPGNSMEATLRKCTYVYVVASDRSSLFTHRFGFKKKFQKKKKTQTDKLIV